MNHTIVYIPGLDDQYDWFREKMLALWALFDVDVRLLPMKWDSEESYEVKYQRASDLLTALTQTKDKVSLVGESAGASMALNLFAAHPKIATLVTIAGVNKSSTPVLPQRLRRSPSFARSRELVTQALSNISVTRRRDIYTLHALKDKMVGARYSTIPGAHHRHIWSVGHLVTIALCLTLLKWYIISLIKKSTSV